MTSTDAIIILGYRANLGIKFIAETTGRDKADIEDLLMASGYGRDGIETEDLFDIAVKG
jgi:hypothetical protein